MRHRRQRRKLGIKTAHRKALLRNLVRALVHNKRIRTTHAKAKEASAFTDKMITIAKRGDLHARRLLISRLNCTDTVKSLVDQVAPKFKERNGGYTRVLRLAPRAGDASEMAILEFTALIEPARKPKSPKKDKKKTAPEEHKAVEVKETAKDVKPKAKGKKDEEAKEVKKASSEEPKKESEKKGGFLGTLRKFLKGTD